MLNERILTLNIGASQLALAEFVIKSNGPELLRYVFEAIPADVTSDSTALTLAVESSLRSMMTSAGIRPARLMVAVSGQMIFPRFVKLSAESPEKLKQMIQFEAEQNVPFPIDEVVWNYELIGKPELGEQHAMIVAAKREIVDAITQAILKIGLEPEIIDIAPMTIYNAVRYNYPEKEGCTLVIDIGAKSTNLVFVEQDRVFCRTIPVAGNTITAEIAKSFNISFEEAEILKCERGLVAQGGAFAVDDQDIDRLSKVIRNVMTRLQAEVSRSINFYRSQQNGSQPTAALLTGGTSQLPYMKEFFLEKLQVEVDFLNPFQRVAFPGNLDPEQFGRDVFNLTDLVGLALRRALKCPIELNLISEMLLKRKSFRKKIPFFAISAVGLVLILGVWLAFISKMNDLYSEQNNRIQERIDLYEAAEAKLKKTLVKYNEAKEKADNLKVLADKHIAYETILKSLNAALPRGMWITKLTATPGEKQPKALKLSVSMWSDLADKATAGKQTIQEIVSLNVAKELGIKPENVKIERPDLTVKWLNSFELSAKLTVEEATPATTRGRRNR